MAVDNNSIIEAKMESFTTLSRLYDGTEGITDPEKLMETVFNNLFYLMEDSKELKEGILYSAEILLRTHGYSVRRPN